MQETLESEFEIIESAVFCEPDDQSAWWYHQFLLKLVLEKIRGDLLAENNQEKQSLQPTSKYAWIFKLLSNEMESLQSLFEEAKSKWILTGLLHILDVFLADNLLLYRCHLQVDESARNVVEESEIQKVKNNFVQSRQQYLLQLIEIDPSHKNRYLYILSMQ